MLRDLMIKKGYDTSMDNVLEDFYYPVLNCAINYDRITGFFTSSSLAITARGISGLINNNGKIRLIVSPVLNREDVNEINNVLENREEYISANFLAELKNVDIMDVVSRNHVKALGFLIANGNLEIKVALVYSNDKLLTYEQVNTSALFHQKIGIISDGEDSISFSGSINETANAWVNNVEEFKTFKSWNEYEREYYINDRNKFDDIWMNRRKNIKLIDLPKAVEKEIIKYSQDFDIEKISIKEFKKARKKSNFKKSLSLFYYQQNALNMWKENGYRLLFEMATGTGKTRTAIGCISELVNKEKKLIVIIACPQTTLSLQWKDEIDKFNLGFNMEIVADGTNSKWSKELKSAINKLVLNMYDHIIIYTTHVTCSSDRFITTLNADCDKYNVLFVGDETHGLGSSKQKQALDSRYDFRIGLSATPNRWFDDVGTEIIVDYYGNKSFYFTLKDALREINPLTNKPFLVNFYYKICRIILTDDELEKYEKLSTKIKKISSFNKTSDEYGEYLQNLIFARANILKNAEAKYQALYELLDNIEHIKDIIIFVTPEQIKRVNSILVKKGIISHQFTEKESAHPSSKYGGVSERQNIINNFEKGNYQVLVAIKCLDEGIDIPSANTAIVMASTSNPREYVQRVGRVIRQAENKSFATIYDFVVKPNESQIKDVALRKFEREVFLKEFNRIKDLSENAINNIEALEQAYNFLEGTYGQ